MEIETEWERFLRGGPFLREQLIFEVPSNSQTSETQHSASKQTLHRERSLWLPRLRRRSRPE